MENAPREPIKVDERVLKEFHHAWRHVKKLGAKFRACLGSCQGERCSEDEGVISRVITLDVEAV